MASKKRPAQGTYPSHAPEGDRVGYSDAGQPELVELSDDTPTDIVATGAAAPGTGLEASRDDHEHDHGLLSDNGLLHHDSDQVQDLSGGGFDNVTDALDDLIASIPVEVRSVFGGMYEDTPGVPNNIVCAIQNTWYPWIAAAVTEISDAAGPGAAIEFEDDDVNGDYLEVLTALGGGIYMVDLSGSFSGTVNETFEIYVFVGVLQSRVGTVRKLGVGGDVGSFSASGLLNLAQDAQVRVKVRCTSGAAANFGTEHMQLSITKQDPTVTT
jgi:hypothetical protein